MKCGKCSRCALLVAVLSAFLVARSSAERLMVTVGDSSIRDMDTYSVQVRSFESGGSVDGFAEALAQAGVLFVKSNSSATFAAIVQKPANRDAIVAFLRRGGIIWFDQGSFNTGFISDYLGSLEVAAPAVSNSARPKYWIVNPASKSPFLTSPELRAARYITPTTT